MGCVRSIGRPAASDCRDGCDHVAGVVAERPGQDMVVVKAADEMFQDLNSLTR